MVSISGAIKVCFVVERSRKAAVLTMTTMPKENLDKRCRTLKSISRNLSSRSPSHVADIYVAAIGLLAHLKVDQATLQTAW
jgi:hypothetical protein